MTSFIRTSDHLTITFDDGVTATVYPSASTYQAIVRALREGDDEQARFLALPAEQVRSQIHNTFGIDEDQVVVEHGIVRFEGKEMDNTLTRRMLQMLDEGFDISPLKLFLVNLQKNPSYRAVNELYNFLEKGNLPITEDGHFLAYKKVRENYTDVHTGKFDNSAGQVVEMPRNEVDEDSRNECSNGLHFCSREYLNNFSGNHIMIVKINPADVVAIPADYNSSKGRTCRYQVIGELEDDGKLEGAYRDTGTRSVNQDLIEDWLSEDEDFDDDDVDGVFHIEDEDEDLEELDDVFDGPAKSDIDPLASSFAGIPADGEPVIIPRDVALEIADSLDDEDVWQIEASESDGNVVGRYSDVQEAADATGANSSSIRKVLNGQRRTAGGLQWKRISSDSTLPHPEALEAHQEHGSLFHGAPHHEGGAHNAKHHEGVRAVSDVVENTCCKRGNRIGENRLITAINPKTGRGVQSYPSIYDAAAACGLTASMIRRVINGERKTTGGYGWNYF